MEKKIPQTEMKEKDLYWCFALLFLADNLIEVYAVL